MTRKNIWFWRHTIFRKQNYYKNNCRYFDHTILDYDFSKLSNTNCTHGDKAFDQYYDAEEECKNYDHCTGVFQKSCTEMANYYMCLSNETRSTNAQIESCVHKKFAISEYIYKYEFT